MTIKILTYELTPADTLRAADFMARGLGDYFSVMLLNSLPRAARDLVIHGEPGKEPCTVDYTLPDFDFRAEAMQ